jgi:phenylacetate-coenzyme A ligase PaaK-like adenylate-forming protein
MARAQSELARRLHVARDVVAGLALTPRLRVQERMSRAQLRQLQQRRLERLVRHAVRYSAFYRELYAGVDVGSSVELRSLPSVSKATLMENFDRIVSDERVKLADLERHILARRGEYYLGRYQVHQSSGSSGQKGIYLFDANERTAAIAGLGRHYALTGNPTGRSKPVRLANVEDNRADGRAGWSLSLDLRLKHLLDLNPLDSLTEIVQALNAFQPGVLRSVASQLSLLAVEQLEGRLVIRPKKVMAMRDLVTAELRARVRQAWGVELFEIYGASEAGGLIAADCRYHRGLHIFEDLSILEVVDAENQQVPAGKSGDKVLLTNLSSYALPRVRFEIPDIVALADEECPCGRTLALLRLIEGRSSDAIRLPTRSGGTVQITNLHLFGTVGSSRSIKEYQVIFDGQLILVRVVLRAAGGETHVKEGVRANLRRNLERLGVIVPPINVEIVNGDRIEREPRHGGKFKMLMDKSREPGDAS